jgi:hypothetical protein
MSVQLPATEKTWIKLTSVINAYILNVISENKISIGCHQNNLKAIKEDAVLQDGQWVFEVSGPSCSYLRGSDEAIVKSGPRG